MRSQDRFSRRYLLIYAVAGVAALSQVPYASALDTIQIPKLSYNPTVDQLISDFDLQRQMVAVDEQQNTLVTAKAGIGFDDNNMNFVNAHVAQTTTPNREVMAICIDKIFSQMAFLTPDMFMCRYWADRSDMTGLLSSGVADYHVGTVDTTLGQPLPNGFTYKAAFTKSCFNQDKEHVVMAAQIPNSYMGPGGQDGKYGIFTKIISNPPSAGNWPIRDGSGPCFPAYGTNVNARTYGAITTQYPIPEFPKSLSLLTLPLALALGLTSIRKNRLTIGK